jgi:uncharacterized protein with PIN domain
MNIKKQPALCLQGEEHGQSFELYVCEPCAEKLWLESQNDDMYKDLEIAENRDDNFE